MVTALRQLRAGIGNPAALLLLPLSGHHAGHRELHFVPLCSLIITNVDMWIAHLWKEIEKLYLDWMKDDPM